MKRLFWKAVYPVVLLFSRMNWISYKWVNVSYAAWHRGAFDSLWHYKWFGTPIDFMPSTITLCGIKYKVTVFNGSVQFASEDIKQLRFYFERDTFDEFSNIWYTAILDRCPASHYIQAYEWIKAVYGGSFEKKRPVMQESKKCLF